MSHAQESEKILFRHAHSEKPWKLNEGVSVNKTTFFLGVSDTEENKKTKKEEKLEIHGVAPLTLNIV